jgi:hypothetical protein
MIWKGSRKEALVEPSRPAAATALPCALLSRFLRRVSKVQPEPHLLMLGELCGSNVTFLGERGFRVCVERDVEPRTDFSYAGALVWDALSLMPPIEARRRTALIYATLSAGGAVLAFFGSTARAPGVSPRLRYRILSDALVRPESIVGRLEKHHPYQNREIIALFDRFDLEVLHTHKDGQREVLFTKGKLDARQV